MRKTRISRAGSLCATAGLIVCAMAAQAAAVNLLGNPFFEENGGTASTDTLVAPWTLVGPDISRCTFASHTGVTSVTQKNTTPPGHSIWIKSFVADGGQVQQTVGITAGATYAFSTWAFFEPSYQNTPAVITVGVDWLNGSGVSLGTPSQVVIDPSVAGTIPGTYTPNQWNQISLAPVAPAGAVSARIFGGWDGGGVVTGSQSAFLDDFIFDGPGTPPPPTANDWIPNGSGDWNVFANWATGIVPNAIGAEANLVGSITAPHTVYSDVAITVGKLKFNNANQYVIAGPGSMTLDVATGNATVDVLAGSHKINLPLRLNDSTTATVAAGATLTIADPLTLANGSTLNKAGTGTLEIISTVTTLGGAAAISTGAGTTNLRFQMNAGTALANSGGETRTFTTQRVNSVTATGGTVSIDSAGAVKVLVTDALTLSGAAKLDVGDNGAIVRGGSTAAIRAAIITGRTGGPGIVTTASTVGRAVGYASSTQVGNPASFLGEAFTGAAVLVRYTLLGDATLDGTVGFPDLVLLAQNYNGTGKEWFQGDFDYDGAVNFPDLVSLAQNYNGAILDSGALATLGGGDFASDWALAQSLVPEPTSLLATLGGLATAALRRRR